MYLPRDKEGHINWDKIATGILGTALTITSLWVMFLLMVALTQEIL